MECWQRPYPLCYNSGPNFNSIKSPRSSLAAEQLDTFGSPGIRGDRSPKWPFQELQEEWRCLKMGSRGSMISEPRIAAGRVRCRV